MLPYLRILLACCLVSASIIAEAHEGRPVYINVTECSDNTYVLKWRIPPVLNDSALPRISLVGESCHSKDLSASQTSLAGVRYVFCEGKDKRPSAVTVNYPRANPVLSTLVRYQWLNGDNNTLLAGPSESRIDLPRQISMFAVIASYTKTGIDHILSGIDHLLFVACLLAITLASGNNTLRRVVLAITGFTIGHSITLAMVTLGSFTPPSRLVETLIAFSIFILAIEIARANTASLTYRKPAVVSILFGLLHGLGFAGALKEIGLPYNQELLALAFFNLGVEAGQLLFVSVLGVGIVLYKWLAIYIKAGIQPKGERALHFVFSRGVGSLSLYWVVIRFLEL